MSAPVREPGDGPSKDGPLNYAPKKVRHPEPQPDPNPARVPPKADAAPQRPAPQSREPPWKRPKQRAVFAGDVLIAYNWPKGSERYRRVDKFVKAFFTKFAEFKKPPRHPSWRDANLAATIPGWKRFPGAEEMLTTLQQQPRQVLDDRLNGQPPTEQELYEEFLRWKSRSSAAGTPR